MRERVNVAAAQMEVEWLSPSNNQKRMLHLLEQAVKDRHPDLVVFPELANTGYVIGRDREFGLRFYELAENLEGPTTEALRKACRQFGVYVVVGLALFHPKLIGGLVNAVVLLGPNGDICGVTGKLHSAGEEHHYFHEGSSIGVFSTELGILGLQVCYDARFPEVSRVQSLLGAEILCVPFAGPASNRSPIERLQWLASTRASENLNFFIACNRVGTDGEIDFYGRSAIGAPTGEILAKSNTNREEILYATLLSKEMLEERMLRPVFRDRRPELYRMISEPSSIVFDLDPNPLNLEGEKAK
ncbi:MAG: carbon-nitrogen hydrolase family protein [Chloroflexi bacterium]|nr:carbon-nitrogen hydrolase family protein [Chloroflexota bacterium]